MASYKEKDYQQEVKCLGNNKFELRFFVNPRFYGSLIGRKGETKNQIEWKTRTQIRFPHQGSENSTVAIMGKSVNDVCAARMQYISLTTSPKFRSRLRPTHFVCAPAYADNITNSFNRIKEAILSEKFEDIDESLFINAARIHITFSVCALVDERDEEKAIQILEECCNDDLNKVPIKVKLHGLKKFDDEPSTAVNFLSAGIESNDLQKLANNVLKKYQEAQLSTDNRHEFANLHMTIMNSKFRETVDAPKTFDATNILDKFADFDFGTFIVNEIHLSNLRSNDRTVFYKALHKVALKP